MRHDGVPVLLGSGVLSPAYFARRSYVNEQTQDSLPPKFVFFYKKKKGKEKTLDWTWMTPGEFWLTQWLYTLPSL